MSGRKLKGGFMNNHHFNADESMRRTELFEKVRENQHHVSTDKLHKMMAEAGFLKNHPSVEKISIFLEGKESLDFEQFSECLKIDFIFVERLIEKKFIIPDFQNFKDTISSIYDKTAPIVTGNVAAYIPQLARINPDIYSVSICTIDGQIFNIGDYNTKFSIQSVSKALNYLIAVEDLGLDTVHSYVGEEPSGRGFNELALSHKGKPFNPMTNAGGIMICSLIKANSHFGGRLEYIIDLWKRVSAGGDITFDGPTYLSEEETGDRNFAIAYLMKEQNIYPPDTNLLDALRFYFQCCSIELNSQSLAIAGATLAKTGVCPLTDQRIAQADAVTHCLGLMYSCGLYDFSGEFSFYVGLPAKTGTSGCLLAVIPNVLGLAIYSPRIDSLGNSVRAVEFCKELVGIYNFHNWDYLLKNPDKIDPCNPLRR